MITIQIQKSDQSITYLARSITDRVDVWGNEIAKGKIGRVERTTRFDMTFADDCPKCDGSGVVPGWRESWIKCEHCEGNGGFVMDEKGNPIL